MTYSIYCISWFNLWPSGAWESYAAILSEKNIVMNEVVDLFDEFWLDRPARPNNPLIIHEYEYTGRNFTSFSCCMQVCGSLSLSSPFTVLSYFFRGASEWENWKNQREADSRGSWCLGAYSFGWHSLWVLQHHLQHHKKYTWVHLAKKKKHFSLLGTFNLRGRDRATSPLFYSYGIITQDDVTWVL